MIIIYSLEERIGRDDSQVWPKCLRGKVTDCNTATYTWKQKVVIRSRVICVERKDDKMIRWEGDFNCCAIVSTKNNLK
jgi:hypothetical protein